MVLTIEEIMYHYHLYDYIFCIDNEGIVYAIHKKRFIQFSDSNTHDTIFCINTGHFDEDIKQKECYGVNMVTDGLCTSVILHSPDISIYSIITEITEIKEFSKVLDNVLSLEGRVNGYHYDYKINDYIIKRPLFGTYYEYLITDVLDEILEEMGEY